MKGISFSVDKGWNNWSVIEIVSDILEIDDYLCIHTNLEQK